MSVVIRELLRRTFLKSILSILILIPIFSGSAYAISKGGCFGLAAAEYAVPGLGYAISGQWDKAIALGGMRWIAGYHYVENVESDYYQEESDDIYEYIDGDDSESGKPTTIVTLTKETWNAHFWGNLYSNLLFTTWGDLYEFGCQPNTETYGYMLSPFRIDHFYDKWQFWLPVLAAAASFQYYSENYDIEYYLYRGLTESDIKTGSFPEYYMVGVGEEMFFRGVVQHSFFDLYKDTIGFSPTASRHLSVLSASAVFALAHSGAGFTAAPATAFLFGIYEGYVYHPSLEEFDMVTAIAIHAWWDILVTYAILNNAEFHDQSDVEYPLARIGFRF